MVMPARGNTRFGWGLWLGIVLIAMGPAGVLVSQVLYRGCWCPCHQCWSDPFLFPNHVQFFGGLNGQALKGSDINRMLGLSMLAGDAVLIGLFGGVAGVRAIGWMRRVHDQLPPPRRACPLCSYPMENPTQRVCPECGAYVAAGSEAIALRVRLRSTGTTKSDVGLTPPALVRCAVCRLEYCPTIHTDTQPRENSGTEDVDADDAERCMPCCPRCHSATIMPLSGASDPLPQAGGRSPMNPTDPDPSGPETRP